MFKIGCHLSSSKGYLAMGQQAAAIKGNTFQFFTRNPRGGAVKPLDLEDIAAYNQFAQELPLFPILAHAPYTMNASAADPGLREFAQDMMREDIRRLEYIPGTLYNFHPGSHVKQGTEVAIEFISQMLASVMTEDQTTTILLETMAGKGSEVGRSFEELNEIIKRVPLGDKLGICLDTCHVSDGGYDIINNLDGVLEEFDKVLGIGRLKAIHLNDSKNPPGSHKDRHEKIGQGELGIEAITRIINHPLLREIPFYLETPNEIEGYQEEIALLRSLYSV